MWVGVGEMLLCHWLPGSDKNHTHQRRRDKPEGRTRCSCQAASFQSSPGNQRGISRERRRKKRGKEEEEVEEDHHV